VRKYLKTAVAAVLVGLGVSAAHASPTPLAAVQDAAPLLAGSGDFGYNAEAGALDDGSQLGGLVNAYQLGVVSVGSRITSLSNEIVAFNGSTYYGAGAYGVAIAGTTGLTGTAANAALVSTFYTGGYNSSVAFTTFNTGPGTIQQYADFVGTPSSTGHNTNAIVNPTGADNQLVYDLAYHVLATRTLPCLRPTPPSSRPFSLIWAILIKT